MKKLFEHFKTLFEGLVVYLSMIEQCPVRTAKIRLAVTMIVISFMFIFSLAFIGERFIELFQ